MSLSITRIPLPDRVIPYYLQISNLLRRKIEEGEFPPGARLPGEVELAKTFGVSRVPVRRALSLLEADGLLIRQRGRGTFVADEPPATNFPVLSDIIEDYVTTGMRGSLSLLSMEKIPAFKAVADFFGISEGARVLLARRLRTVEGTPYSLVLNYLPVSIAEKISTEDLNSRTMVSIFEQSLGVPLRQVLQAIEARNADHEIAVQLSVETASPVMYVETFLYSRGGEPVEFSQTFYRGDRYKYLVELDRKH